MRACFGTDGLRGKVPEELNLDLAVRFGFALGDMVREHPSPAVVVGRDPRRSSDMLEAAVTAGLYASGVNVERLGVIPTPAVALLTAKHHAQAGVMISASHNAFQYNGIKCFDADGKKLSREQEQRLERSLYSDMPTEHREVGQQLLTTRSAVTEYTDHLSGCAECDLSGIRVLFDCANGAASVTVPRLIRCLDLDADVICCAPDGVNINDGCGAVHPERLAQAVRAGGYQVGIALDGDADRCIAVDETGAVMDGDDLLGIFALHWQECGRLNGNAVVGTVMSNRGLCELAEHSGIGFYESDVGDSRVRELMERRGCVLGGEPSGHLIFSEYSTTGDGELTAVCLLRVMAETGKPASLLRRRLERWTQIHRSIDFSCGAPLSEHALEDIRRQAETQEKQARLILRCSGTEPLIRIMTESRDGEKAVRLADETERLVRRAARLQENWN